MRPNLAESRADVSGSSPETRRQRAAPHGEPPPLMLEPPCDDARSRLGSVSEHRPTVGHSGPDEGNYKMGGDRSGLGVSGGWNNAKRNAGGAAQGKELAVTNIIV